MTTEILSDFSAQWCQDLLNSADIVNVTTVSRGPRPPADKLAPLSLFTQTLRSSTTIRAWQSLQTKRVEAPRLSIEFLLLLSLGTGLGSFKDILHGGVLGAITDQAASICAWNYFSPAVRTKQMLVRYHKSVPLPSVVLARSAAIKREGKQVWVRVTIENGTGMVFSEGDVLFYANKLENL